MSEEVSPRKPKKVKAKLESAAASSESLEVPVVGDGHRERKVSEIVVKSDFADEGAKDQAEIILSRFNEGVDKSAFTLNPALGRALPRCDITYFAMGHRNQVVELMDPKGQRYATVYTADPTQTIKSLGTVSKTAHYFGAFGKHVLNVPAGHYALAFSKNRPVIYGEGPHVIIDPTFQFNESTGFVNQQEPYIHHQTIHILRVPAGRVAKVWVGTLPHLFESRRAPYVIVDPQFRLVSPEGSKKTGLFLPAGEPYIEHGSIKRIIPHTGEVAITYNNGILTIIPTPKDGKPVIIDSPTHHFDGFISTALQTCLFPSKETKQQAIMDNSAATADEVNLKIFQTRDSLRVGVVLVVAFKIVDPECAITKLGKDGIIPHIENVSFADMGKAIQLSTLQEVMYFTQNRPKTPAPGTADDQLQTIQDRVRNHLARDLADYGIELARLQIETMKVLDTEIAKKLAGQSVTSAEFTTKQATLVKEYDIKTTEARLKAETDNIALSQANQARIAEAQARFQAAQREAEALIIAAEAQKRASELQGELFEQFPELLELELLKIKSHALRTANVYVTPRGESGSVVNSPLLYMPRVQQTPPALAHPTKEEALHLQHKAEKKAAKDKHYD